VIVNWTRLAESRIEEAIAGGEFDDLPGRGQPLDLTDYFALPAAERAGAALLRNANVVPPEVELLKTIGQLETALGQSTDPGEAAKLRAELQERRVAFSLAMERRRREPRAFD
jgi:hypothetical protein